jgi:hypothetical protein
MIAIESSSPANAGMDRAPGDPGSLDIGRRRIEQAEARPRDICSRGLRARIGGRYRHGLTAQERAAVAGVGAVPKQRHLLIPGDGGLTPAFYVEARACAKWCHELRLYS